MPAAERASPFYTGTNEFFVYSVIAVYKVREFPRCRLFDASQILFAVGIFMMRPLMLYISLLSLLLLGCGLSENRDKPKVESLYDARGECYRYEMCLYKDVKYHCIMDTTVVDEIVQFIEKVEHNIKDCQNCFMDTTLVNEMLQYAERYGYNTESDASAIYKIHSIEGTYDPQKTKHVNHSCCYAMNKRNGCDTLKIITVIKDRMFVPHGSEYEITKDSSGWKIIKMNLWVH